MIESDYERNTPVAAQTRHDDGIRRISLWFLWFLWFLCYLAIPFSLSKGQPITQWDLNSKVGISENAKSMFSSIFELIGNRGFKITVEGVEATDQVVFLNEFENFWYQGYLFSKPLPYIDLIKSKFLQDRNNLPIFNHPPVNTPALQ